MRKVLLIVGIIAFVLCVLTLLYAALNWFGYNHTMDGSAALYDRLHRRMIIHLIAGIVLAVAGTVCMIVRIRL